MGDFIVIIKNKGKVITYNVFKLLNVESYVNSKSQVTTWKRYFDCASQKETSDLCEPEAPEAIRYQGCQILLLFAGRDWQCLCSIGSRTKGNEVLKCIDVGFEWRYLSSQLCAVGPRWQLRTSISSMFLSPPFKLAQSKLIPTVLSSNVLYSAHVMCKTVKQQKTW